MELAGVVLTPRLTWHPKAGTVASPVAAVAVSSVDLEDMARRVAVARWLQQLRRDLPAVREGGTLGATLLQEVRRLFHRPSTEERVRDHIILRGGHELVHGFGCDGSCYRGTREADRP